MPEATPTEPLIIPWVAERITTTENPRHLKMLKTLIQHLRSEVSGDLEGTMGTMVKDPIFNTFGPKGDTGAKGHDAVRKMYAEKFVHGDTLAATVYDVRRFVQDDHTIVMEFTGTVTVPWQVAKERGYAIPEEKGRYALRNYFVSILPFDEEGLLAGEIAYGVGAPNPADCEPVADDELSSASAG